MRQHETGEQVPGTRRAAVYALIAAIVVCGLFEIEWWPLTGWKLFSSNRTPIAIVWKVETVDDAGEIERLDLTALGPTHVRARQLFGVWEELDHDERRAACMAWFDAARRRDPTVAGVQLTRVVERRHLDDTSRAEVVRTAVRQRCGRTT